FRGDYGVAVIFKAGQITKGMTAQGTVEILLEVGLVIGLGELFDQSGENQKAQTGVQVFLFLGHLAALYGPIYPAHELLLDIVLPVHGHMETFIGSGTDKPSFELPIA